MPAALESTIICLSDQASRRANRPARAIEPTIRPAEERQASDEAPPHLALAEEAAVPLSAPHAGHRVELIVEYANSLGLRPQVNFDSGVISGVKILGPASRNGRQYRPAAMAAAAPLYEGVKVNVNHPKGGAAAPRDYQDRLGSLRNVRVCDGGLFGDLHFNPHHPVAAQLAWDAQRAPENVGLSHNVQARTSRQEGQTVVEQILRVNSVDLVADPATTHGLFESAGDPSAAAPETEISVPSPPNQDARGDLALTEARQQLLEKRRHVQVLLREAGLPGEAVSAELIEQLSSVDEATARGLIQERAQFYRSLTAASGKPKSKGPTPDAADHGGDVRRWARLIT
jgi:hypothetical protein